jgi:polynucleotide 5'-hydroxyl-kinase GRC3/NOL9
VSLLSGEISVLGAPLQIEENLIVREGKRLPLWVKKRATVELRLGEGSSVNEVDAGTVLYSWDRAVKELMSLEKPVTVMVMGGIDSGKTSFCTYLVNAAVKEKLRTAVIDSDLGQSDVGPPLTVGYNFVTEPVKDLFEIDARDAVFVGVVSPSGAMSKVVNGLVYLKKKVMEAGVDFLVVNTDGWVEGNEASSYKVRLAETVGFSAIVGIQQENELIPILDVIHNIKPIIIDSPRIIQQRSREKRKLLRELSYKKYMKGAKLRSFSFGWVKVKNSLLGSGGQLHNKRLETLGSLLKKMPVYSEETFDTIIVVLKRSETVNEEQINAAEEHFGKKIKVIFEGDEEGLLVGLKDENDNFLGIGILHEVDYKRKTLKIYTPVSKKPFVACFGQIKLNKNFREIGLSRVFSKGL